MNLILLILLATSGESFPPPVSYPPPKPPCSRLCTCGCNQGKLCRCKALAIPPVQTIIEIRQAPRQCLT